MPSFELHPEVLLLVGAVVAMGLWAVRVIGPKVVGFAPDAELVPGTVKAIEIEGHTDNTGSAAKNEELSLKRAIAVRDYLIAKGVAASATDVAGLGASSPIADNTTADGRARNRRVEIVVSGGPLAK